MSGQILAAGSTFSLSDGSTTTNASAVQTITTTATGGTLVFGYSGGYGTYAPGKQLTAPITAPIATIAALQAALVALPNIGNNAAGLPNVVVSGTVGAAVVTFQNDLANQPVPLITLDATSAPTGGSSTIVMTTPGTKAGGVYAALAALTDMVFPTTKKDVKETTNFDSAGFTKEYIGGFINPGDVKMNAMWNGGATQDWKTGIIAKFYSGSNFAGRTNIPNKTPQPGLFTPGLSIAFGGLFTDGSPAGAKHDDIITVSGSVQISGLPVFGAPVQA
jgi:hypothetical protein